MPAKVSKFLRSAGVGAVATLVDLSALQLLVHALSFSPEQANLPALLLGVATQFFGTKLFAFKSPAHGARLGAGRRIRRRELWRRRGSGTPAAGLAVQGGRFLLVEAGAIALNAIAFALLIRLTPLPLFAARLAGSSLVYFAYSYPLWDRIFAAEPAAGAPQC
jgi:putative flippase GtrA